MRRLSASARWDLWRVVKMSPAPVWSSWLKTNWLRWEPPRWETRAQQLNTIDMDVETNCITRPRRSELTCSAHDCCAAVLIKQRQWAAAESRTDRDPSGSSSHGSHDRRTSVFMLLNRSEPASRNQGNFLRGPKGESSNFRIITFAAAFRWQDATCAHLLRLKLRCLLRQRESERKDYTFIGWGQTFDWLRTS